MKIVKWTGCTTWRTEVDDKDISEVSNEKKLYIINNLINKVGEENLDHLINTILDYVHPSEPTESSYCDRCDDIAEKNTYEIL